MQSMMASCTDVESTVSPRLSLDFVRAGGGRSMVNGPKSITAREHPDAVARV